MAETSPWIDDRLGRAPLHAGSVASPEQLGAMILSLAQSNGIPAMSASGDVNPRLIELLGGTVATALRLPVGPRLKATGRPPEGPRLVVRPARGGGRNEGMIYIRSHGVERSTRFRESERDKAEALLALEKQQGLAMIAGYVVPTTVPISSVVHAWLDTHAPMPGAAQKKRTLKHERAKKKEKLSPASFNTAVSHLKNIMLFFRERQIADITEKSCKAYVAWRIKQPGRQRDRDGTLSRVSDQTALNELSRLRACVNSYKKANSLDWSPTFWLPDVRRGRVTWLKRSEICRLLLASRGWLWVDDKWLTTTKWDPSDWTTTVDPKTGRWRSVATPGGSWVERPVIDRVIAKRLRLMPRLLLMALYTGSRHTVLTNMRWTRNGSHGYIDFDRGIFRRIDVGQEISSKGCGPCRIPARLLCKLRIWREADRRAGIHGYIVRSSRGLPFKGYATGYVATMVERAGMRWMGASEDDTRFVKPCDGSIVGVSLHTFRHTCATWMSELGVPLQVAANFLDLDVDTLVRCYAHWTGTHYGGADVAIDLACREQKHRF